MSNRDKPWEILNVIEARARRRFGQHFLARPDIVARMVKAARLDETSRVLEIGPGLGVLTEQLVESGAEVTAVELDRDLAEYIRGQFPTVRLVEGDAAKVDWDDVCPGEGWKVVANLPYNVGTGLTLDLIRHSRRFSAVLVMLQHEVVARMCAVPGTKAYGALTVMIQARADCRYLIPVPPGAFHPPPKVKSAVVMCVPYPEPQVGSAGPENFDRVVKAAFSQRRKTLTNSLSALYSREGALAGLEAAGIDPGMRAERVDVEGYRRLAAALHPST